MPASLDDLLAALQTQNTSLDNMLQTMQRSSGTNTNTAASRNDLNFHLIKTSGSELAKSLTQAYMKTNQATKDYTTGLKTFNKELLDGTKKFNSILKNTGATFTEQLKSGELTAQDFNASINDNIRQLARMKLAGDITRDQYRDLATQLKRFQTETLATAAAYERLEPYITSTTKAWKIFDDTALRMVRSYQGSSDGFSTAANLAKDGLSLISTGAEKAGGYVTKFGGVLSNSANPAVAGFGAVVAAAGVGLEAFGAAAREVIDKAFPIFQTQITKMAASYNMAASTGALFGQGMTELVRISADAGLSTETFSKIIKENSAELAKSGMGVAEGAKQVASVGKIMRDSGTREELLKFGFSLEEQGGLIAQTVAKMRSGGGGAVDQQKVAEATAKYAKDLRTLADLTGEDVKTKEKQVQEAANNLAFQQQLAQMAPEQREKIQRAMEAMAPIERKAFMERMINHGNVMSEETAMMESQSSAYREKQQRAYELALSGQLDLERQSQLNTEYGESIKKDMLAAKDVALAAFAGVETVGKLADNMNTLLQQSLQFTPEALEKSRQAAEDLAKKVSEGGDPLTQKFVAITEKGEELRAKLDSLVGTGKAMDMYLQAVEFTTTKMLDLASKFAGGDFAEELKKQMRDLQSANKDDANYKQFGIGEKIESSVPRAIEKVGSALDYITFGITGLGTIVEKARSSRIEAEGKYLGERKAEDKENVLPPTINNLLNAIGLPKFAAGGMSMGSETGYGAILHGAEAVLPLDNAETMSRIRTSLFGDGDNVMNKNTKDMATAMAAMLDSERKSFEDKITGIKSEANSMMENLFKPNMQTQDRVADMLNNKLDEMISLLKDVSNHTELTSSRVA